jgi:hypothetical protein
MTTRFSPSGVDVHYPGRASRLGDEREVQRRRTAQRAKSAMADEGNRLHWMSRSGRTFPFVSRCVLLSSVRTTTVDVIRTAASTLTRVHKTLDCVEFG